MVGLFFILTNVTPAGREISNESFPILTELLRRDYTDVVTTRDTKSLP